jgi:hypothetical protein
MHFYYLDETGCTGPNLQDPEQPIFVIGGLRVSDERWRKTIETINTVVSQFFGGAIPKNFELHAHELINCGGPFDGRTHEECNAFAHQLIDTVGQLKHEIHFIAIDKAKLFEHATGNEHKIIDCRAPYLLGFNYLVTAIERNVSSNLGKSARAMIILDNKDLYQTDIDNLTRYRRYEVPEVRRIKRIVEFSHPVDSKRHPLVQLSDLIIFLTRKLLECENGYKEGIPPAARNFFASCYEKITDRVYRTTLIDVRGEEEAGAHKLLAACQSTHRMQWRNYYQF